MVKHSETNLSTFCLFLSKVFAQPTQVCQRLFNFSMSIQIQLQYMISQFLIIHDSTKAVTAGHQWSLDAHFQTHSWSYTDCGRFQRRTPPQNLSPSSVPIEGLMKSGLRPAWTVSGTEVKQPAADNETSDDYDD